MQGFCLYTADKWENMHLKCAQPAKVDPSSFTQSQEKIESTKAPIIDVQVMDDERKTKFEKPRCQPAPIS